MSIIFERTVRRLEQQVEEGLFTRGAQMTVEIGGQRVLDLALGESGVGQPMSAEHIVRVYCTIKPITAVAVARLVEDEAVDLDEPLELRLRDMPVLTGGVTLRHVLTHTAGLHLISGVSMELLTPSRRRRAVADSARPPGWRLGVDAAYSEYAGWHVLGWLIEEISGEPLREHLRRVVLDPLDLHTTWIGMSREEYRNVLPLLGVNTDLRNLGGFPMLFERGQRVCTETNPAHGGYTNARDLARFYGLVLERLQGATVDGLPAADTLRTWCSPARPVTFDLVLDRECSFGLGFMTQLEQHAFGDRCSNSSFGHSGNVGASFAFADPDHDLAVGVVFNGLVGHETAFLRRRALINALYADLGANEAATEPEPVVSDQDARHTRGRWLRRARR